MTETRNQFSLIRAASKPAAGRKTKSLSVSVSFVPLRIAWLWAVAGCCYAAAPNQEEVVWRFERNGTEYRVSRSPTRSVPAEQRGGICRYRLDATVGGTPRTNLWQLSDYYHFDSRGRDIDSFEFLAALYDPSTDASVVAYTLMTWTVVVEYVKRGSELGRPAKPEYSWRLCYAVPRLPVCRVNIDGSLRSNELTVQLFEFNTVNLTTQERLRWAGENWKLEKGYTPLPPPEIKGLME